MKKVITIISLMLFVSACSTMSFPGVHRLTIQQGNVITQAMIDKLKPGMTKSQVRYVLGNPVLDDSLMQNRWDYLYTIQVPGIDVVQSKLQVYFIDGRLSYFEGDFAPTDQKETSKNDLAAQTNN